MFTQGTQNYGLPQWLPQEKPTWLGDMNSAFLNIDTNLKSVSDTALLAQNSAVQAQAKIGTIDFSQIASTLSGAVLELADRISNILTRLGYDNISQIGTSITNAILNIGANITTLTTSVNNILTRLGNVVITEVGTSITDAIINLQNAIYYIAGTYTIVTQTLPSYVFQKTKVPIEIKLDKTIKTNSVITLNTIRLTMMNEKGYLKIDSNNIVNKELSFLLDYCSYTITNNNNILKLNLTFNQEIINADGTTLPTASAIVVEIANISITIR